LNEERKKANTKLYKYVSVLFYRLNIVSKNKIDDHFYHSLCFWNYQGYFKSISIIKKLVY
jgi:hypothetical protein